MTGALDATDLDTIVLGTIAEGCIGETVAAIEAAEALQHCTDDATRAVLARIAPTAPPSSRDLQLAQHGLIAPSLRHELRRRVLDDVIAPCAHALIDGTPPAPQRALASGVSLPREASLSMGVNV